MEKKGRASSCCVVHRPVRAVLVAVVGGKRCSSLYRLLAGGQGRWEFAPVAAGQGVGGAFGSEGLFTAEHVPDRFGESTGEVDLGDLGAALLADPRFRLLVVGLGLSLPRFR
jgi:hypothetical protein